MHRQRAAPSYLDDFIARCNIRRADLEKVGGGVIPTARPNRYPASGKYMAIAEAARLTDPIRGAGIHQSLASGQAAAAWATGRPVPSLEWLYKELERRYRLKRILYRLSDRSLDRLMGKFNLESMCRR